MAWQHQFGARPDQLGSSAPLVFWVSCQRWAPCSLTKELASIHARLQGCERRMSIIVPEYSHAPWLGLEMQVQPTSIKPVPRNLGAGTPNRHRRSPSSKPRGGDRWFGRGPCIHRSCCCALNGGE